ncbi:hypothetical protein [Arcobacter sp. FWKO B]|uniref:hypothetical protein n=1 Tax=Arcobacter sp. FWKO B TaxID=2593672 RepID=UPI0018A37ED3|nr:hypothetical protein [Arcobacter sp. FWKO B]QOG11440.1 hypothetical protein FWKOB_01470 [Arcobacter sp. FWKO B]
MEIVETLNQQIDKLLHDYEELKFENLTLKVQVEKLKDVNDELLRNNEDMLLNIDRALAISKAISEKKDSISY